MAQSQIRTGEYLDLIFLANFKKNIAMKPARQRRFMTLGEHSIRIEPMWRSLYPTILLIGYLCQSVVCTMYRWHLRYDTGLLCVNQKYLSLDLVWKFIQIYLYYRIYNELINSNEEQRSAVQHIVSKSSGTSPYIVFGPPGTGKTMTIVEAIIQVCFSINNVSDSLLVTYTSEIYAI